MSSRLYRIISCFFFFFFYLQKVEEEIVEKESFRVDR